ncbi:sensor histidine kinase [Enterococcus sp. AZ109]|uniref:sensor histidine kinase n=1 Tax=Enterococcus sp. AZ109 TaxID=2774634 RepID=UPI003F23F7CA
MIVGFLVVAVIGLIGCGLRLYFYRRNVKKLNQQLDRIIENFGTNEQLKPTLTNDELTDFTKNINRLITLYKQEQQQAKRQNRELKQEITNISHDFRTPLTSIKGFSDLLQDSTLSEAERQDYLSVIQQKVNALTMVTDVFYEISQIESADYVLNPEKVILEPLLLESLMPFYRDFEKKQLQVTIKEEHLHTPIMLDPRSTKRILFNLIQNGLRYAESSFTIEVLREEEYLVLQTTNDVLLFQQQDIERIFERTYTVDQSREKGQTGLGLYIVKQLAEKQGGKVAASYQEHFFTIKVYFPL